MLSQIDRNNDTQLQEELFEIFVSGNTIVRIVGKLRLKERNYLSGRREQQKQHAGVVASWQQDLFEYSSLTILRTNIIIQAHILILRTSIKFET